MEFRRYPWAVLVLTALFVLASEPAFAAGGIFDGIDTLLTNVLTALSGTTGRLIGAVALVVIGIGCLVGRITWMTGLVWAIGIGIVTHAKQIADSIG